MLHELIMCLLGYVGGLFQLKIENNKSKIKVITNIKFFFEYFCIKCLKKRLVSGEFGLFASGRSRDL